MATAVETEALSRARGGLSASNYAAIVQGFADRGIPVDQIEPRANVLTYRAWRAVGRQVRRGEHGIKVPTWVPTKGRELSESEQQTLSPTQQKRRESGGLRPRMATVFHVSQTDLRGVEA